MFANYIFAPLLGALSIIITPLLMHGSYLPSIYDFKPVARPVYCPKPLYLYNGKALYYSHNGQLDNYSKPIWNKQVNSVLVSPDSKKIVIIFRNKLSIVDNSGNILGAITPIRSIYEKDWRNPTFFREDGIQWASDSQSIYIIEDTYYKSDRSQLFSKKGALKQFTLAKTQLHTVITPFQGYEYFFSANGNIIYFSTPTFTGDLQLESFNKKTNQRTIIMTNTTTDLTRFSGHNIFYSFVIKNTFGDSDDIFNYNGTKRISVESCPTTENSSLRNSGLFLYNGKVKNAFLIFSNGLNTMKHSSYSMNLNNAYFLPGNRYFMAYLNTNEYSGNMLFDTKNMSYMKVSPSIVYFSITTKDVVDKFIRITESGLFDPQMAYLKNTKGKIQH